MEGLKILAAKLRNVFMPANFSKRNDDGTIQVTTTYGRTIDKTHESFPHGFIAKSEKGAVTVLCANGSLDAVKILPVESVENAPALDDGDMAIYAPSGGGFVICRKDGTLALNGTDNGGVVIAAELKTQLDKMTVRLDAIMNAINTAAVAPMDGGATFKANMIAVISAAVNKENFSAIESNKVSHGTG